MTVLSRTLSNSVVTLTTFVCLIILTSSDKKTQGYIYAGLLFMLICSVLGSIELRVHNENFQQVYRHCMITAPLICFPFFTIEMWLKHKAPLKELPYIGFAVGIIIAGLVLYEDASAKWIDMMVVINGILLTEIGFTYSQFLIIATAVFFLAVHFGSQLLFDKGIPHLEAGDALNYGLALFAIMVLITTISIWPLKNCFSGTPANNELFPRHWYPNLPLDE